MGGIEWGERRAGEQVWDFASGPGKGGKGLEKADMEREEVECRLPGQAWCLISLCLPTPSPSGMPGLGELLHLKTEHDSDPSG